MVTKLRRVRGVGQVTCIGKMRNEYKILIGIPERKRPLGRLRYKWEDNIRIDLKEIRWESMNWNHLAQDSIPWQALLW
jgi:hypothetical protein